MHPENAHTPCALLAAPSPYLPVMAHNTNPEQGGQAENLPFHRSDRRRAFPCPAPSPMGDPAPLAEADTGDWWPRRRLRV